MIKIALAYFRTHKIRNLLSMFTVFIAVGLTTFFVAAQLHLSHTLNTRSADERQLLARPPVTGPGRTLSYSVRKSLLATPHVQEVVAGLVLLVRTPEGFNYRIMACDLGELELMQAAYPVDAETVARWRSERTGIVIGKKIAAQLKLLPGMDLFVPTKSGQLSFKVVGISQSEILGTRAVAHWEHVDEATGRAGQANVFRILVDDARNLQATQELIEQASRNTPDPLLVLPESEVAKNSLQIVGGDMLPRFLGLLAILLLSSTVLVLGNNIAASTRERTSELAALRAIGFSSRRLATLLVLETTLPHLAAGTLAIGVAAWVARGGVALNGSGFTSGLTVNPAACGVAFAIALLLPLLASLVPAWQASRQPVAVALREGA